MTSNASNTSKMISMTRDNLMIEALILSKIYSQLTSKFKYASFYAGLHKRPLTRTAELLPVAKIFRAERVIIHENFTSSTLDFDVTLVSFD